MDDHNNHTSDTTSQSPTQQPDQAQESPSFAESQEQTPGSPSPAQQTNQAQESQVPMKQPEQNQESQASMQQPDQGQQKKETNNLALASMIVGIFALLTCCIPFIQFPLAMTTIVLVILSKRKRPFHGFAIAGLVLGILAAVISIGMTIYLGFLISLMKDPDFMSIYNSMLELYQ